MPRLKGIERIRNQFDVVRVRCCDDQRQRKPHGVRQQAALYALFPSVLRIATCFLFLTAAIWSYNRPSTTRPVNAVQMLAGKQTVLPEALKDA